jgi:hypothetical protein
MQEEVQKVLLPAATRFGDPPDGGLMLIEQSSAILTDDVFARDLEVEERIGRLIDQALGRLEKLEKTKKSNQQNSFREAQRLSRRRK